MAPKKRRRHWEDEYEDVDGQDDDIFGLEAQRNEEQLIKERRNRLLKTSMLGVHRPAASVKSAPPGFQYNSSTPSSAQTGASIKENLQVRSAKTNSCIDQQFPDNERELRTALLQIRDSAGENQINGVLNRCTANRCLVSTERFRDQEPHHQPSHDMFAATPEIAGDSNGGLNDEPSLRISDGRDTHEPVIGVDDPTDEEGYARIKVHELLDGGRYTAGPILGRGVFANVYRATSHGSGREVAIKVLRNNDVMRRAGILEMDVLRKILEADPHDKRHCVRMLDTFEHRGHVVIVFEALSMNLRDVIKRFGGGKGIRLSAVRIYGSQLLSALNLLRHLGIVHADIKPDNALVSADRRLIKLCDFGSAMQDSTNERDATPYLVSRFYRAPEVILGLLPYGGAIDMWSVACVLFEMYTGQIAFPGRSNNEMLRLIQEACGSIPSRVIKKSFFRGRYFDDRGRFLSKEVDSVTGAELTRPRSMSERPKEDFIRQAILAASLDDEDRELAPHLADLLAAMFVIDPSKRTTPSDAIKSHFFTTKSR